MAKTHDEYRKNDTCQFTDREPVDFDDVCEHMIHSYISSVEKLYDWLSDTEGTGKDLENLVDTLFKYGNRLRRICRHHPSEQLLNDLDKSIKHMNRF